MINGKLRYILTCIRDGRKRQFRLEKELNQLEKEKSKLEQHIKCNLDELMYNIDRLRTQYPEEFRRFISYSKLKGSLK